MNPKKTDLINTNNHLNQTSNAYYQSTPYTTLPYTQQTYINDSSVSKSRYKNEMSYSSRNYYYNIPHQGMYRSNPNQHPIPNLYREPTENVKLPPLRDILSDVIPKGALTPMRHRLNANGTGPIFRELKPYETNNLDYKHVSHNEQIHRRFSYNGKLDYQGNNFSHINRATPIQSRGYERDLYYNNAHLIESNPLGKGTLTTIVKPKRIRRKFEEINRVFACTYSNCKKSYGTLNHLNSHIVLQNHGKKKTQADFRHLLENKDNEPEPNSAPS